MVNGKAYTVLRNSLHLIKAALWSRLWAFSFTKSLNSEQLHDIALAASQPMPWNFRFKPWPKPKPMQYSETYPNPISYPARVPCVRLPFLPLYEYVREASVKREIRKLSNPISNPIPIEKWRLFLVWPSTGYHVRDHIKIRFSPICHNFLGFCFYSTSCGVIRILRQKIRP